MPTFSDKVKDGKEYRKKVYFYDEMLKLIEKYGMPQDWNSDGRFGPERDIEAHVWSDETILRYTEEYHRQKVTYEYGRGARRMLRLAAERRRRLLRHAVGGVRSWNVRGQHRADDGGFGSGRARAARGNLPCARLFRGGGGER